MSTNESPTGPDLAALEAARVAQESIDADSGVAAKERDEEAQVANELASIKEQRERLQELIKSNQEFLDKFDEEKAKQLHDELDPEDWGPDQRWQEIHNAMNKGLGTAEEALVTLPERTFDMFRGVDVGDEEYKPTWNPYENREHPITKTWWGGIIDGFAHYGSIATLAAPIAKGLSIPATGGLATTGITAALTDRTDGDSVSTQVIERAPWTGIFLGPFATSDDKHPVHNKLLNILEEMYAEKAIDGLFGLIWKRLFGSAKQGVEVSAIRKANVDAQILEKGRIEFEEGQEFKRRWTQYVLPGQRGLPGDAPDLGVEKVDVSVIEPDQLPKGNKGGDITTTTPPETPDLPTQPTSVNRGHKNKPIADLQQGSPNSTKKPYDIYEDLNRIDNEWTSHEHGSTSTPFTVAQAERMATNSNLSLQFLKDQAKELLGDVRFIKMLDQVKKNKASFREVFEPAYRRYQEIMGRDIAEMSTEEFWSIIENQQKFQTGEGPTTGNFEAWSMENVIVADLVNSSLFKQLRDLSIGAREISEFADIFAVDGPMKTIADRLVIGLTNVKRSRYLISTEFSKLKGPAAKKALKVYTENIHKETMDGVRMMMQMMKDSKSKDLAHGILEIWSEADKIQNWMDFDAFMRKRVYGGDFKGKRLSGQVGKELYGVFVNSALSWIKTPLRAFTGTAVNGYTSQWNRVLGSLIRYPFHKDSRSVKASIAALDGMHRAAFEAWDVMYLRLKNNFKPEVKRVTSRFGHSADIDFNWDIQRQWLNERGNWLDGYRHALGFWGRKMNTGRITTWGPRTLDAVDEGWAVVKARSKAREEALLRALDAVEKGDIPEITPEVLKNAEDLFFNGFLDEAGDIDVTKNEWLEFGFREDTLTTNNISVDAFNQFLNEAPIFKRFMMFLNTSVNELKLNLKNMPVTQLLFDEFQQVIKAKPNNLEEVAKYGITNADELSGAQDKWVGRIATGMILTKILQDHYIQGKLSGNGPIDASTRKNLEDTGWVRNSINIFGKDVNVDLFEPWSLLMKSIADIGDNMYLMGPEWAEQRMQSIVFAVAAGVTNKSFMQGANDLVNALKGTHGSGARILAGLMNNQLPLGSARNGIGELLNPYQMELSSSLWDSIKNRNKGVAQIIEPLPRSWNILNGKALGGSPLERAFGAVFPYHIRGRDHEDAQRLIKLSNYDQRLSTMSSPGPDSLSLKEANKVRSMFQKAIGDHRNAKGQSLGDVLDALWKDPDIQASIAEMKKDIKNGDFNKDPMKSYYHNRVIRATFKDFRQKAWAAIRDLPEVQYLLAERRTRTKSERSTLKGTTPNNILINEKPYRSQPNSNNSVMPKDLLLPTR